MTLSVKAQFVMDLCSSLWPIFATKTLLLWYEFPKTLLLWYENYFCGSMDVLLSSCQ